MSQAALVAFLIMPLSLATVQAHAQMVPAATSDITPSFLTEDTGKLYNETSDRSGPELKLEPAADHPVDLATSPGPVPPAAAREAAPPDPSSSSSSVPPDTLLPPAPASDKVSAPASAAPVTLPVKPAKVRDLPALSGDRPRVRPFRAAAFGLTASSLGAGSELAIPVARTLNLRAGASYILLHSPFNVDGIDYTPTLKFTSGRATVDWFPHHGAFHISAGALYFRNSIGGSANVVEGQSFTLGGTSYLNSVDDPVHGSASIVYGKQIAPMLLLGFGNILPRSGRHLSVPFEFGGAYMQPPTLNLKLSGTACTTQGCFNAATDPQIQTNLAKEINTLQSDIRVLEVYPIVSLGLACRF